jgi:hypothetical protein
MFNYLMYLCLSIDSSLSMVLDLGNIDNAGLYSAVRMHITLLSGHILHRLGDLCLRDAFELRLVLHMRDVVDSVLNLLIVSVRHLNGLISGVLDGLIIGLGGFDRQVVAENARQVLVELPRVRHLFMSHDRLVVSVVLLDRHVFD